MDTIKSINLLDFHIKKLEYKLFELSVNIIHTNKKREDYTEFMLDIQREIDRVKAQKYAFINNSI